MATRLHSISFQQFILQMALRIIHDFVVSWSADECIIRSSHSRAFANYLDGDDQISSLSHYVSAPERVSAE